MRFLARGRGAQPSREKALADARKATSRLRRTFRRLRRHQDGKQEHPIEQMTPNQWLGG